MTQPPGHLWRYKWIALSGPLSGEGTDQLLGNHVQTLMVVLAQEVLCQHHPPPRPGPDLGLRVEG